VVVESGEGRDFLVKYSYHVLLERLVLGVDLSMLEEVVFKYLWKSVVPSKVIAFFWALLLDTIPNTYSKQFVMCCLRVEL